MLLSAWHSALSTVKKPILLHCHPSCSNYTTAPQCWLFSSFAKFITRLNCLPPPLPQDGHQLVSQLRTKACPLALHALSTPREVGGQTGGSRGQPPAPVTSSDPRYVSRFQLEPLDSSPLWPSPCRNWPSSFSVSIHLSPTRHNGSSPPQFIGYW